MLTLTLTLILGTYSRIQSAFAFWAQQQQVDGNMTHTSGQQQQDDMDTVMRGSFKAQIEAMVEYGFQEWEATHGAKSASDVEGAIALIQSQR